MRQNEQRRMRNRAARSKIRSDGEDGRAPRRAAKAPERDTTAVHEAIRALDKAVTKGVIHRNTAARKKSALARKLNASPSPKSPRAAAREPQRGSRSTPCAGSLRPGSRRSAAGAASRTISPPRAVQAART